MKITVDALIAAPIHLVWNAYTNPKNIVQWNAASDDWHTTTSTVDLRVGGAFSSRMEAKDGSFGFNFEGIYTEVVENRSLAYSFGDRAARVVFQETSGGVQVTVTFDAENQNPVEMQQQGWQAILNNFKRHVECL